MVKEEVVSTARSFSGWRACGCHCALVIAFCLVGASAFAVPGQGGPERPPAPTVDSLVAAALANAPSLAARRARIEAAAAIVEAADVLPDPMVEFEFRQGGFPKWTLGSDPMSMVGATVRQPLVTKGRRTARRAASEADVEQRHAEADATACDLTAAVRAQYAALYVIDRERAIVKDALELARLVTETAISRYAAAAADQATVLRAQLELTRLGERAVDLESDRAVAVAAMNRLVNAPAGTPFGEVVELPEPPVLNGPLEGLPDAAGEKSPEVSMRKSEVGVASRRVDLAREDLRPTYTVGGGFYWQGGTDRVATATLGIEWPTRKARKQLPALSAAQKSLEAAQADLEDAVLAARTDASRLVTEIRRAEVQISRYKTALLPQSSAALDAARSSYLAGRGDFAAVLDEFRRWTDVRVELARREASRFAARGQLDVMVNPAEHGAWTPSVHEHAAVGKEAGR
jgi:outer membrane protein TolC